MSSPRDQKDRGKDSTSTTSQPDEQSLLKTKIADLEILLGRATARVQKLETELDTSRAQVAWFHCQLFGQKAERTPHAALELAWRQFLKEQEQRLSGAADSPIVRELSSVQLLMDFLDPRRVDPPQEEEPAPMIAPPPAPDPAPPPSTPPKKGHGRNRPPTNIEQRTIVLEPDHIPEGARCIGTEISHRIAIQRARVLDIVVVRPKYAVILDDDTRAEITVADPPAEMIPRGMFAPSGLAHLIADKFDRHVPYNRIDRFFERSGYRLPTSTLSGVAIRGAPLARALVDAMTAYAQEIAPYLAIDATGVLLQQPKACIRGHVWLRYVERTCVLVSFSKTHDSQTAAAQLDGWNRPALMDGAQVYDEKLRETGAARAGCWSHARRKLFYAITSDPRALVGLNWINKLFEIERDLLDATPEERQRQRADRSAPIVADLFSWRDELLARGNLGRSLLAKALGYLRNQSARLKYFIGDGRVPIHNNETELRARHLAIGRKNWLFFGSVAAAHAASTWLSLVLSARMHDLDVEDYLRDLFRVLPLWPQRRILELAPHRWRETRARLDPLELAAELGPITVPPSIV